MHPRPVHKPDAPPIIAVRLPRALYDALNDIAADDGRDRSELIREAVAAWVAARDKD